VNSGLSLATPLRTARERDPLGVEPCVRRRAISAAHRDHGQPGVIAPFPRRPDWMMRDVFPDGTIEARVHI
jgi:hypothetical protein